jgi:hypothetical protein
MMQRWLSYFNASVELVFWGCMDSLSVHRALPLLLQLPPAAPSSSASSGGAAIAGQASSKVAVAFGKCVAVNLVLLLGSIAIYDRAVLPALEVLRDSAAAPLNEDALPATGSIDIFAATERVLGVLYSAFWLFPIWGICFALSTQWYMDIATEVYTYKTGQKYSSKTNSASQSSNKARALGEVYGLVVWAVLFLGVQVLKAAIPAVLHALADIFPAAATPLLRGIATASWLFALSIVSVLYGWYAFDYHWMCRGDSCDRRFDLVEAHWAYLMGFGLPYVVVMNRYSFLVAYGVYLILFPLSIMLAAEGDYRRRSLDALRGEEPPALRRRLQAAPFNIYSPEWHWVLVSEQKEEGRGDGDRRDKDRGVEAPLAVPPWHMFGRPRVLSDKLILFVLERLSGFSLGPKPQVRGDAASNGPPTPGSPPPPPPRRADETSNPPSSKKYV